VWQECGNDPQSWLTPWRKEFLNFRQGGAERLCINGYSKKAYSGAYVHTTCSTLPIRADLYSGAYCTIYLMRVYCYQTWADAATQEQLWLCAEAVSAMPAHCARFYIREDRLSFAFLLDPTMRHIRSMDYYL